MTSVRLTLLLLLALLTSSEALNAQGVREVIKGYDARYITRDTIVMIEADGERINEDRSQLSVSGKVITAPGPLTLRLTTTLTGDPYYVAWEVAGNADFTAGDVEKIHESRVGTTDTEYTLYDAGTFYLRFTADFIQGNDTVTYLNPDKVYQVTVSESMLEVPNIIVPDSPSGKNVRFLVKYRSLRSFELWVYNRWGQELYHTTDPSDGWDGHIGGSIAPTGAYYYLVKAEGTDDIKYVKKGALNLIRTRGTIQE